MAAVWSSLLRDPLELILEKLDLADHARFASVCSSWRSVAINNPPINKPLYLAFSYDPKNLLRRFITSFIPISWNHVKFIGVMDEWLVILIDHQHLFVLNKAFNSVIPLPSLPPYSEEFEGCKLVLSSPPSSSPSGECTIVLKLNANLMYYCRLGSDESFTKLLDTVKSGEVVVDILFYEGRLFALCGENIIKIFDNFHNKVPQMVEICFDAPYESKYYYIINRMLISGNKIMMSTAFLHQALLFKFEQDKSRAVQVSHINDSCLLFINPICSISITPDDHAEFRLNKPCISSYGYCRSYVLDMRKDPRELKVCDPCQLYSSMFELYGISNKTSNGP